MRYNYIPVRMATVKECLYQVLVEMQQHYNSHILLIGMYSSTTLENGWQLNKNLNVPLVYNLTIPFMY